MTGGYFGACTPDMGDTPEKRHKLPAERIAKLEALGMVWTVPQEG